MREPKPAQAVRNDKTGVQATENRGRRTRGTGAAAAIERRRVRTEPTAVVWSKLLEAHAAARTRVHGVMPKPVTGEAPAGDWKEMSGAEEDRSSSDARGRRGAAR